MVSQAPRKRQSQDDYQVTLDAFHGPLDLLLYLIRRAEVDIEDIPIATITDQYLAFLNQLDEIDIDAAGQFLVMAASLIEVKSRLLMPPGESSDDEQSPTASAETPATEPADPRYELVQQLLAYQRYRTAVEELEKHRQLFQQRWTLRPAKRPRDPQPNENEQTDEDDTSALELELEDVHIGDLADSYRHIAEAIDFTRLGEHTVEIDDTPIELYQEDLIDRLQNTQEKSLTLQDAFVGHNAQQRIGMFLATLELTRMRRIDVVQPEIESPVEIMLRDDEPGDETTQQVTDEADHSEAR